MDHAWTMVILWTESFLSGQTELHFALMEHLWTMRFLAKEQYGHLMVHALNSHGKCLDHAWKHMVRQQFYFQFQF